MRIHKYVGYPWTKVYSLKAYGTVGIHPFVLAQLTSLLLLILLSYMTPSVHFYLIHQFKMLIILCLSSDHQHLIRDKMISSMSLGKGISSVAKRRTL